MNSTAGGGVAALRFDGVSKSFPIDQGRVRWALKPTDLVVHEGETTAIVGRSGSGKSTLLHLAAGIEIPTAGTVTVFGRDLAGMDDRERSLHRRDTVGLVFQFFHLLPHLTLRENIRLPAMIAGDGRAADARVEELLERVHLADRADETVDTLSGGEMQRVAICRALLRRPRLLLADEPTGNLDDATSGSVMSLMLDMVREQSATLIYVTHSPEVAGLADRELHLSSGAIDES